MKKTILAFALLSLYSCSDEDLLNDTKPASKYQTGQKELNLAEFDAECIHISSIDNDPAGNNRECVQSQIDAAVANGYDGLHIGALDFYVNVTFASNKSLQIPSNFALVMDANTIMRVTPNSAAGYGLIDIGGSYDAGVEIHDVLISGGQLVGDRVLHNNPVINGHLMRLFSSHYVTIDGVSMREANCDGIYMSGKVISIQPNYTQPSNIKVTNCTFDSNRRSNMSITDGYDIEVSNSTFLNAGVNIGTSTGAAPKLAIDVEGDRVWNSDHTALVWYKHPHDINIHNNIETGSVGGSFIAALADHVAIANNDCGTAIGYTYGDNITLKDNYVHNAAFGILAGFNSATSTVNFDNVIQNNRIENCAIGLALYNKKVNVIGNTFTDCGSYAITFTNVENITIKQNTINSAMAGSSGIKVANGGMADNVSILNNDIAVYGGATSSGISIVNVNNAAGQESYKIYFEDNDVKTDGLCKLQNITGMQFANNTLETQTSFTISYMTGLEMTGNAIVNTAPTANINALLIKDCTAANTIKVNYIENQSSNGNSHAVQIGNCANLAFFSNSLKHNMTKTLYITNLTDSLIDGNTADIGTSTYFVYATGVSTTTINANTAAIPPYTRQSVNGVITIM